MNPSGSGGKKGGDTRWEILVSDWKAFWGRVLEFANELRVVAEAFGNLILNAVELGRDFVRFLGRHSGTWLVVPVAAGATSPVTGGWGVEYLAESTLRTWSPVVVIPLASILVLATLRSAESDGDRLLGRGGSEPEVEHELAKNAKLREMANEELRKGRAIAGTGGAAGAAFEDDQAAHDVLSARYLEFFDRHSKDFTLVVVEQTPAGSLRVCERWGVLGDVIHRAVELPWEHHLHPFAALEDAVQKMGYAFRAVPFAVANRHLAVVGLSETEIGDLSHIELSRAATVSVAAYTYGSQRPAWLEVTSEKQ